ncbi:unnamed protein product, partial [Adineta steineri]
VGPPSSANFADGGKNPSQEWETLPIPQVPIRLMNVWYGKVDGIMDLLPSKFGGCSVLEISTTLKGLS